MSKPLVVKLIAVESEREYRKYFDNDEFILNGCKFVFDKEVKEYNWLVVYNNLPRHNKEELQCSRDNTLLITLEPEVIQIYNKQYTDQFNHISTSQSDEYLQHPNKHYSLQAYKWWYGAERNPSREYILKGPSYENKTKLLSSMYSTKFASKALHKERDNLIKYIKKEYNELDLYKYDRINFIDKMDTLDSYKYHICIENHRSDYYITEKIADCFLGRCLPFYIGAPNIGDYFPEESYILLEIYDREKSLAIIKESIINNEFEKRIKYIEEARRLVLEKHNMFSIITNIILNNHKDKIKEENQYIYKQSFFNKR